MVDPHDLAEDKQALCEFASTRYAESKRRSAFNPERTVTDTPDEYSPDPVYDLRKNEGEGVIGGTPSHYWNSEGLNFPDALNSMSLYSKSVPSNGMFVAEDVVINECGVWLGFELGMGLNHGIATLTIKPWADRLELNVGGAGTHNTVVANWALPSDYDSAEHTYAVNNLGRATEFYVDGSLVGVGLKGLTEGGQDLVSGPPYEIFGTQTVPNSQPVIIEPINNGTISSLTPKSVRWTEGAPYPPRRFPLHDSGAETLLTEGTYDSGSVHYSHPVPTHKFREKTMMFRADTASVADGLVTEVLTRAGNWRTIDTYDLGADEFYYLDINVEAPVVRVGYEPSSDGASITDAEINLG